MYVYHCSLPVYLDVEENKEHEGNYSDDEKPAPTVEMRILGTFPQIGDGQAGYEDGILRIKIRQGEKKPG